MGPDHIQRVVEAALFAAVEPVSIDRLVGLFTADELAAGKVGAAGENADQASADDQPADQAPTPRAVVRDALAAIETEAEGHGYQLARVASGYRFQVRAELSPWVNRLFRERPPSYSRALLETLALIAYRQPITRAEVTDVRGVPVSASIMRTLLERGWVRAVGQRETPGRPTMYGTTRAFLDYFNLRSLSELPPMEKTAPPPLVPPADAENVDSAGDDDGRAAGSGDAEPQVDAEPASNVVRLPSPELP